MDKRFLTPEEVANATINASIKKAMKNIRNDKKNNYRLYNKFLTII